VEPSEPAPEHQRSIVVKLHRAAGAEAVGIPLEGQAQREGTGSTSIWRMRRSSAGDLSRRRLRVVGGEEAPYAGFQTPEGVDSGASSTGC